MFPAPSVDVVNVATPLAFTVAGTPRGAEPSRKVTVPVGAVALAGQPAAGQTVAVNVTVWPRLIGDKPDRTVVVPAWLTFSGMLVEFGA